MIDRSLKEYIDDLSSPLPTPGGGSVGNILLSFSASLVAMVCGLTKGLEGYIVELNNLKDKFYSFHYEDEKCFNLVMEAYKLPKNNEEEKKIRKEKIQEALKQASIIPFNSMKLSKELVPFLNILIEKGNKNAISDVGVSILNLRSGVLSGYLNVIINLKSIKDENFVNSIKKEVEEIKENIVNWCDDSLNKVIKEILEV
ncbi:MAG: cyclodeaminase/cyclohydrolase family protein [Caldisericia bacterium]